MPLSLSCFLAQTPEAQAASTYQAIASLSNKGASVAATNTRPNDTTAYVAGDIVGTNGFTFENITNEAGRSAIIRSAYLLYGEASLPAGMTTFTLHLYNAAQAVTDNAPFDIGSNITSIQDQYLGSFTTAAAADSGGTVLAIANNVNVQVVPTPTSTNIYGVLVTNGGFTPAAQTIVGITLNVEAI